VPASECKMVGCSQERRVIGRGWLATVWKYFRWDCSVQQFNEQPSANVFVKNSNPGVSLSQSKDPACSLHGHRPMQVETLLKWNDWLSTRYGVCSPSMPQSHHSSMAAFTSNPVTNQYWQ